MSPKKKDVVEEIVLPNDSRAERGVCAAVLIEPALLKQLQLTAEDFWGFDYGLIYRVTARMFQSGKDINERSVWQEILKEPRLPKDVSASTISEILEETPTAANVKRDAETVSELSARRKIIAATLEVAKWAREDGHSAIETMDKARELIEGINWKPAHSRYVIFRDAEEIEGDPPHYQFTVIRPSDGFQRRIRFKSEDIDARPKMRRIIRETMHFNPLLPSSDRWEHFVHELIFQARLKLSPEALGKDNEVRFWVKEWFKGATPVVVASDLVSGYVDKGDFYYIQPQRLHKWLADHAKIKVSLTEMWAALSDIGAEREKAIKIKDTTRRLWSIPKKFFEEKEEPKGEEQLPLKDEALDKLLEELE